MSWLSRWRRKPPAYDAALLPLSGDVVVTGADLSEVIPAEKARAIADAVAEHDAAVAAGIIRRRRADASAAHVEAA